GRAHQSDLLAAADLLTLLDVEAVKVAVPRFVARRVGDDDQSTVALLVPVRLEYFAGLGGDDGRPLGGRNVKTAVAAWREPVDRAEERGDFPARGPDTVERWNQRPHGRLDSCHLLAASVPFKRGQAGDQVRIDARVVRNGPLNARRLTSRWLGPRLSKRVDVWSGRQRREEQQRGYGDAADTERA